MRFFVSHPDINIDCIHVTKVGGTPPLWEAVCRGRLEIAKCLLDPKACNISIDYSLAKMDQKMIERKQLQYHKGANPNGVSHHIPIHTAAMRSIPLMKLLVQYGASVNALDEYGQTALMKAATWQATAEMEWLIQNGANMTAKNQLGESCSNIGFESNNPKIIKILLKYNCDLSVIDETTKQTPFQMTASNTHIATQDLIFRHFLKIHSNQPEIIGSIINEPAFENGGTAFHVAVRKLRPDCVHYLTQINADPTLRDMEGN